MIKTTRQCVFCECSIFNINYQFFNVVHCKYYSKQLFCCQYMHFLETVKGFGKLQQIRYIFFVMNNNLQNKKPPKRWFFVEFLYNKWNDNSKKNNQKKNNIKNFPYCLFWFNITPSKNCYNANCNSCCKVFQS